MAKQHDVKQLSKFLQLMLQSGGPYRITFTLNKDGSISDFDLRALRDRLDTPEQSR